MTNNEAIKMLRTIKRTVLLGNRKFEDALDVAISALEGKNTNVPSNNQIDRQSAIDALDKRFDSIPMEQTAEILQLRKDLRELPSVQPERRKGRWRKGVCECGYDWAKDAPISSVPNFCPNCGADMREVSE